MPLSTVFIPHGGGPLPLMGDPAHRGMIAFLKSLPERLPRPEAIVVISAHYESREILITGGEHPPLVFDYSGFPPETYEYRYDAPGAPALAEEIAAALGSAGMPARIDRTRGFDHGVFVPLMLIYPEADIPVLQLSLSSSLDPAQHLDIGKALAFLAGRNVLVLGSGLSFHNMRALFHPTAKSRAASEEFHDWLVAILTDPALSDADRRTALTNWAAAPGAKLCQPREEHLLPLHVCAGLAMATGMTATIPFDSDLLHHRTIGVVWH